LAEYAVVDLHLSGPVLCINHDDSAWTDQDMVEIGFWTPRPSHIMQDQPALRLQTIQYLCHPNFACRACRPGSFRSFCLIELGSQLSHALSRQARLLGSPVSCPHIGPPSI
jgi:hypothetical protein